MNKLERLENKVELKDLQLDVLLRITQGINSNLSSDELFDIYKHFLREELEIPEGMLLAKRTGWQDCIHWGVDDVPQFEVEDRLPNITEIGQIAPDLRDELAPFDMIVPILHKERPLAYLLLGDGDEEMKMSPAVKHYNFIQTLTNTMMVAIENKRLAKEMIAQERAKRELELAAEMQSMLIPTELPSNEQYEFAAFYQPHQEVGGDHYDLIPVNENELVFCVADVSGKGVSAAMIMSNFQATLRALVQYTEMSLTEMVHELNRKVMESAKGEKFITLFLAHYNKTTNSLTYVNAGHNPPVVIANGRIDLLKNGCIGIGMLDAIPAVQEGHLDLGPGTTVMCYTDGLVEQENAQEEEFGMDRMIEVMTEGKWQNLQQMTDQMIAAFEAFRGETPYLDDTAVFSFRVL